VASIAAIAASEAFNFAYAWSCRRVAWPLALVVGMVGWVGVAILLTQLPAGLAWAVAAACVAVAVSQSGLPRVTGHVPAARLGLGDLAVRMLAGALLTVAVLAVSAQRAHGADFVALLMRGMVIGRASFAAFFAVTATMLPRYGVWLSFACAALVSIVVQGATRRMLHAERPVQRVPHELAEQQSAD
jgi:1,4-dihydroxy-2-naphthoate octaprenyltransferase